MNQEGVATVRIERASALAGMLMNFKVAVDGHDVEKVANGSSVTVPVVPGRHTFHVGVNFLRSRPVTLDLHPGDAVTLRCGVNPSIAVQLLGFLAPGEYLYLTSDREAAAPVGNVQAAPKPTQDNVVVALSDIVERVPAATEDVRVPSGVTVKVKRSRTVEHTVELDWTMGGSASLDVGVKDILGGSIRGEISRKQGAGHKDSETVEYEIELSGDTSHQYRLVWTDVWRTGVAHLSQPTGQSKLPFRYRERTELEVVPVGG